MTKLLKHTISGWKTTLFGTILILSSLGYLYYIDSVDKVIFFGLLATGISLIFLPDTLFKGLGKLINKNAEKEL